MHLEFEDDDLRRLAFEPTYFSKRWSLEITEAYRRTVQQLLAALDERDLYAIRGLRLEQLKGKRKGTVSVRINSQYRLILRFTSPPAGRTAIVIEAVDYH